jgi:hypothetical protein
MSNFDAGSFARAIMEEAVEGLRGPGMSIARLAAGSVDEVDDLVGKVPFFATTKTLNRRRDGVAQGSGLASVTDELSYQDYKLLLYGRKHEMTMFEAQNVERYIDPITRATERLFREVQRDVDTLLDARLSSSSLNAVHTIVGDEWNGSAPVPYVDLVDAKDKCPEADTIVLGRTAVNILRRHPDTKAQLNFYSSGAYAPGMALASLIAETLEIPVENVFLGDQYFNSAGEGLAVTLGRVMGDNVWIGKSECLRVIEQRNTSQLVDIGYDFDHKRLQLSYHEMLDIVRADPPSGIYLQKGGTPGVTN